MVWHRCFRKSEEDWGSFNGQRANDNTTTVCPCFLVPLVVFQALGRQDVDLWALFSKGSTKTAPGMSRTIVAS